MDAALLISLIPSISAVAAAIVTAISFICKVKGIVKNTKDEDKVLKKQLIEQQKSIKELTSKVDNLIKENEHLIKQVNKVKEVK